MFSRRAALAAVFTLALGVVAAPHTATAQPMMQGFGDYARLPMFRVNSWRVHEQGFDAVWTFEGPGRNFMHGVWTDRQTGQRQFARHMRVYREGQQIIINRPGLGNYVGTIQPGGRSIEGTLSWSSSRFRASAM